MYDSLPDEHQKGVAAFVDSLEHQKQTCSDCGFEDAVLHSEWKTHVETDPRSGHILYKLTCPDCDSVETVDVNIS